MIITIDTVKDTPEDIQKAVQFLSSLVSMTVQMQAPQQEMQTTAETNDAFAQLFDMPATEQSAIPPMNAQEKTDDKSRDFVELPKVIAYRW